LKTSQGCELRSDAGGSALVFFIIFHFGYYTIFILSTDLASGIELSFPLVSVLNLSSSLNGGIHRLQPESTGTVVLP
jgi:hypothetical protein